jgi:hypothetical protein
LNLCINAPVDDHSHQLFDDDDNNITFYRSKSENRASRYELKLNRLSEREKVISKITYMDASANFLMCDHIYCLEPMLKGHK